MENFQRGYLGIKLNLIVINPIIGIPMITIVTLFVTLGLILLKKKVPILKTIIGKYNLFN